MFDFSQLSLVNRALDCWNAGRTKEAAGLLGVNTDCPSLDADTLFGNPFTRLAVYGSLAPGDRITTCWPTCEEDGI